MPKDLDGLAAAVEDVKKKERYRGAQQHKKRQPRAGTPWTTQTDGHRRFQNLTLVKH